MKTSLIKFLKNESGATAIEYGVLASCIAIVLIPAANTLGSKIWMTFYNVTVNLR
ncbi:MAG: Flp family type IVb pilin [Alphaproteobacteria bacterium]|nr:Flp family type IVb pilin [Alphaproteobacteria bacterium]